MAIKADFEPSDQYIVEDTMKNSIGMVVLFSAIGVLIMPDAVSANGADGFHISGRKVIDSKNNEFIMRGINHAHTWYESQLSTAIPAIAKTGANCVRIVLSNGKHAENWGKNDANDLKNVIKICKDNKLISVLEVHDCTGYPEKQGAVKLSTAVDYWIEMKNELIGQEAYVIINIANEPFGNNVQASTWVDEHKTAIKRLRDNGFKHLLIVDAANWGQDCEKIMQTNASDLFNADEDKNILFSVHMYDLYKDAATVDSYLKSFVDKGLPLIVGEFAADHGSAAKDVDEEAILSKTKTYGIGYIGWSWKGNSSDLTSLDIASQWNGSSLSAWGNTLINSTNGIKANSVIASVFTTVGTIPCLINDKSRSDVLVVKDLYGLNVTFESYYSNCTRISLVDLAGNVIQSKSVKPVRNGTQQVYFSGKTLSAGTYVINITDNTGTIVTRVNYSK